MTPAELQAYLHERIPLTRAMAVSVIAVADDEVVLEAPLAPNTNHQDTVFGGSAASLATLAAWSLLHVRVTGRARLVIQHQTMAFHQPITGTFRARAGLDQPEAWARFERALARKGRARMSLSAVLEYDEEIVGRFNGDFVALRESDRSGGGGTPVGSGEVSAAEEPPRSVEEAATANGEVRAAQPTASAAPADDLPVEAPESPAPESPVPESPVPESPAPAGGHAPRATPSEPAGSAPAPGDEPASVRKASAWTAGFAVQIGGERRRQRPVDAMPDFVRRAIDARRLMPAFEARPAHQREEYLAWITGAEKAATQGRRLTQMLDELEGGDRFMSASWRPGDPPRR